MITTANNKKQPNILLIVMDATRAHNLSCYGYGRPTTPNLERFAERAVVYEKAIATSCWSLPTHASMFTGLSPSAHGANDQHHYLDADVPIITQYLQARGYQTVALCRKHDVSPATGMDRGFAAFNPNRWPGPLTWALRKADNGMARAFGYRDGGARHTNREIRALLPRLQAEERPFFLFVSNLEAHLPYRPPRAYNKFLPDLPPEKIAAVNQDNWKYMAGEAEMDEADFAVLTALYDGALAYSDYRIGQILTWFEQAGLLEDTLVIITGDHGENLGDHQLMGHGYCLYDSVLHVPLIIHYPRNLMPLGRVAEQVQHVDLLPTILAVLGDETAAASVAQGNNLLNAARRDFAIAEQSYPYLDVFQEKFPNAAVSQLNRELRMIRAEQYKYIWCSDGQHELYDLQADPQERHNLIDKQPAVAQDLAHRLAQWQQTSELKVT